MRYLSFDIGIKNLGCVKLTVDDDKANGDKCISNLVFGLVDLTEGKKTKKISFESTINNLFEELSNIDLSDIDMVLIENQPALMNPICKSISVALYSFFTIKLKNVKFVSAVRKLGKEGKKLSYKQKKEMAVVECFKLIAREDKTKIEELSRQHDIADAILQAYRYHMGN